MQLARLARQVIALDAAVSPTAGYGRWLTLDGRERIDGVVGAVNSAGTVDLELHLIAHWPAGPLERLAAALRDDLVAAAREQRLDRELGSIDVSIHDLVIDRPEGEGG